MVASSAMLWQPLSRARVLIMKANNLFLDIVRFLGRIVSYIFCVFIANIAAGHFIYGIVLIIMLFAAVKGQAIQRRIH
jgi:NADH:ubiquinone oxidoreductase subunit K